MQVKFWVLIVFATMYCLTVKAQSTKKLQENNGFKNHKLGSKYTSLYGTKSKQPDGTDKVVVLTKESIGNIPVQGIDLIYIADTLARIIVQVETHYHSSLLEACKGSFGMYTKDISSNEKTNGANKADSTAKAYASSERNYSDQYLWEAPGIIMEYRYIYPKVAGDRYAGSSLTLIYSLKNYDLRLQRFGKKFSAKDF